MKIGVITYWQSGDNYGQALQCFALQKQLISMGHTPFLIKYVPLPKKTSLIEKLWKLILIYPIFKKLRKLQWAKAYNKKNKLRRFDEFREMHIITNGIVYNGLSDIQDNPPEADCYICGSDQIWAMLLDNDQIQAFYLNFGKKETKRIAYAASFGRDIYPAELNSRLHEMLVRFDAVSVREKAGIDICAKVGIQAIDVLDPTLLLSIEEYSKIIEKPSISQKYFYTYSINILSDKDLYWGDLLEYANRNALMSISTIASGYLVGREICSNTQYIYATIPAWLGYIQNAEFVATTSFHGVVFCLILHTNFIYIPLKGKYSRGNGRAVTLLKSLGLHDKIFNSSTTMEHCIEQSIDWRIVDAKISMMKKSSLDFLKNSLATY